jgi:dTDP-4-amino-4,6-dideoxygalactose transaminase
MSTTFVETTIPLCDLKAQDHQVRSEIRTAIDQVIDSQNFILGPQVAELESHIAQYCGTQCAVGCSSGTDALLLALMALEIRPGDEVITSPYTFFATAGAISRLGAKAVFVDIDPATFNIDAAQIQAAITQRTKAIIPVHLFGQPADMDPIVTIARRHNLAVVEDAAQAIGAEYNRRRAGSMGDIGCFSFFPSKNLGCYGDGGMVVTNNADLADKMRLLRTHGAARKYYHEMVGGNFRLDTLQAAILLVKLKYLDHWNAARIARADIYRALFHANTNQDELTLPTRLSGCVHVFNQFVIRVSADRNRLMAHLKEQGIATAVYYPMPLHLQECFASLGYCKGSFPEAERAANESLAIPMFPELTQNQQRMVVESISCSLSLSSSKL